HEALHAISAQRVDLLAKSCQARWRVVFREELPRNRLERQDRGRHAVVGGSFAHDANHFLVSAMDAVESADSEYASPVPQAQVVCAWILFHRGSGSQPPTGKATL